MARRRARDSSSRYRRLRLVYKECLITGLGQDRANQRPVAAKLVDPSV